MDGAEEVTGGFVVACGDGSELLEFAEEVFDEVARLVDMAIIIAAAHPIFTGWDDGGLSGVGQGSDDARVGIIGFVGD